MKRMDRIYAILLLSVVATVGALIVIYLSMALIIQKQFPQYSISSLFLLCASGNHAVLSVNNSSVYILLLLSRILEAIALAIISSFIFSSILNRGVKIIFPDKLVIRRRTSQGSDGTICIGILVGNPRRDKLFDVECCVNCTYIKEQGEICSVNSEVTLVQTVKRIRNYYRFSFEIDKFHKKFWQDFLTRDEKQIDEDNICVTISGRSNTLGGIFTIERNYGLLDIGIDLRNPESDFKRVLRNNRTGKTKTRIDWRKFSRFIEASEDERAEVVAEIRKYAQS